MPNEYLKFKAGITEKGIDTFNPDFNINLVLSEDSYNLMTGINKGTGPRYGISPIPAHSNLNTSTHLSNGLLASEDTPGDLLKQFYNRRKFLGIVPFTMPSIVDLTSDLGIATKLFFWFITDWDGSQNTLTGTPNTYWTSNARGSFINDYVYQPDIGYGFYNPTWEQVTSVDTLFPTATVNYSSPVIKRIGYNIPASAPQLLKNVLKVGDSVYYGSTAVITVSGAKWPQKWIVGRKVTNGDASNTAIPNTRFTLLNATNAYTGGISPSWNTKDYKQSVRTITFYNNYATNNQLANTYIYSAYNVDGSTYKQLFNEDYTSAHVALTTAASTIVANARGAAFVAANVTRVLINDDELVCDSSYRLILFAAQGAYAYAVQDWERDFSGRIAQTMSLTNRMQVPQIYTTTEINSTSLYKEYGYAQSTCFEQWPSFDGTTPLVASSTSTATVDPVYQVTVGPANSGILRSNTAYEFTFSVFDKQFGTETNVGKPAKFLTGANDFVAITLKRDQTIAGVFQQVALPSFITDFYWSKTSSGGISYGNSCGNFIEIRFYYRPLGSYEWLPALFIDFPQWNAWPDYKIIWACQGAIAALPGGQPGGFVDNSQLPDDTYDCTVNFKNRAFWLSAKNLVFSKQNNPFAYPIGNSAPAPTGGYRGAIIHTYRGQSEQESRLVIFGQKETYIGRFTGIFNQMPVQVSPSTSANFDIDGSDFTIEPWTSVTAFSYRSAVVADGDLYYWGPQGIYMDNGVGNPEKISKHLEPNIFNLYDPSLTAEIHCHYDERTKDIIWFFPPLGNNTISYALTYDIENGEFFIDRFKCKVDWAQRVDTTNAGVTQGTNGLRTVIASRQSSSSLVQRGYFFDQINRSGDWSPTRELLARQVTTPGVSSIKKIEFDLALNAANFATIAVGDTIAIQQFKSYTGQATGDDMLCKVTEVNTGGSYLLVKVPDGATLPNVSLAPKFYFPIWHKAANGDGLNGIPWEWHTKYWLAAGVNDPMLFMWLYLFFKYTPWFKSVLNSINVAYRTPSGGDFITDVVNLVDNSDTNCQIYHALRQGQRNNQGQAIKFKLSGSHIGEEWMLQYLEAQGTAQQGNLLKEYQG